MTRLPVNNVNFKVFSIIDSNAFQGNFTLLLKRISIIKLHTDDQQK